MSEKTIPYRTFRDRRHHVMLSEDRLEELRMLNGTWLALRHDLPAYATSNTEVHASLLRDQRAELLSHIDGLAMEADSATWATEDVLAEKRMLRVAVDCLIARALKAEGQLKAERIQSDLFQGQVRRLVQRELELMKIISDLNAVVQ